MESCVFKTVPSEIVGCVLEVVGEGFPMLFASFIVTINHRPKVTIHFHTHSQHSSISLTRTLAHTHTHTHTQAHTHTGTHAHRHTRARARARARVFIRPTSCH